jgi:hypothetical protein
VSQVTVCPVVGVVVGVQAARAGSAAQANAAAASAQAEALLRKEAHKRAVALNVGGGANRFDEDADCSIDVSRFGTRRQRGQQLDVMSQGGSTYHRNHDARRAGGCSSRIMFDRCRKSTSAVDKMAQLTKNGPARLAKAKRGRPRSLPRLFIVEIQLRLGQRLLELCRKDDRLQVRTLCARAAPP